MNPALPSTNLKYLRKGGVKALFITATDTGAGKTTVTRLLKNFLLKKGYNVITQKWIETGITAGNPLRESLRRPYIFKFPASPHLSARLEKRKINSEKITRSFKALSEKGDFVIVEGTGGALVPFTDKKLIIDIAKKLRLSALVVVDNRLGAINHTLLTVEALKGRGIKITGIIFNNRHKNTNNIILKDNAETVRRLTGEKVLGILPYTKDRRKLQKAFAQIGAKVSK